MKKIPIALLTVCSWTLSNAQSSSPLNLNSPSIKISTQPTISTIIPSSNSGTSLAISSSVININGAVNVNAPQIPSNSNIVISATGAAKSLANIANTSRSITQTSSTNVTASAVSATIAPNITSIAPATLPINAKVEKLVVTKTIAATAASTFHRPEIPKPDAIVNLYKSSHPQPPKAPSVQAFSLASMHNQESIVQLSNKVSLVVASEGLGADRSTTSTAELVDAISSPHSLQNKQLMLSMLKQ